MSIFNHFEDWKVDAFLIDVETAPDENGKWVETPSQSEVFKVIFFRKSYTQVFKERNFTQDVDAFVVTDRNIDIDSKMVVDGEVFEVVGVDEVADQKETWEIPLKKIGAYEDL